MDNEIAHFNEMLLENLLSDAEKNIIRAGETYQVDCRAISILRTIPEVKLQTIACQSQVALAVPVISDRDIFSHSQNGLSILPNQLQLLNYEYLLLIKQIAKVDLSECILKLTVQPTLATAINQLSSTSIRHLAQSSSSLYFRAAITTAMARTMSHCCSSMIPFIPTLSSMRSAAR